MHELMFGISQVVFILKGMVKKSRKNQSKHMGIIPALKCSDTQSFKISSLVVSEQHYQQE